MDILTGSLIISTTVAAIGWLSASVSKSNKEFIKESTSHSKFIQLPDGTRLQVYDLEDAVRVLSKQLEEYKAINNRMADESREMSYRLNMLTEDKVALQQLNRTQRDRHRSTRDKLRAAQDELLLRSDIKHIKFTARLPDGSLVPTMFKLGLGNCGLTVKSLRWEEQPDRYVIHQLCTNGDLKSFEYAREDVLGRIEFRKGEN